MDEMSKELKEALMGSDQTELSNTLDELNGLLENTNVVKVDLDYSIEEIESSVPDIESSDAKKDYIKARNHAYNNLEAVNKAMVRALHILEQTEHLRAFDAFNNIAGTARLCVQDLLNLQKTYKEVTKNRDDKDTNLQVLAIQNNVNDDKKLLNPEERTKNILEMVQKSIEKGEIKPI